jgi:hypothetical protein
MAVLVDDIIQTGPCKGPVAEEPLADHAGTLNLVFVCTGHGRRELLARRPGQLVNVVMRADQRIGVVRIYRDGVLVESHAA